MSDSITARAVADAIIRNELERREDSAPAQIPDARPLDNVPAQLRAQIPDFNGVPASNPWAQNIIKQLVRNPGGGRT